MSDKRSIQEVLSRLVVLLEECREERLAQRFKAIGLLHESDPKEAARRTRSLYGGMGSFNDLVLHGEDGVPLRSENIELDNLRTELFGLCQ